MSKIVSLLLLLVAFSMPANAKVHDNVYVVDKVFCTGRALMGKAGVEARQQGFSRKKWEYQLTMMRKDPKSSEFLYAAAGMALLDLDTIYRLKSTRDTTQIYLDLFGDCMAFQGMSIRIPDDRPQYASR